jgi:hypothetical protein
MTRWRKSSHSGSSDADKACVEVAALAIGLVGLRDSKHAQGPHLAVSATAFGRLVREIKGR